MTARFGGLLGGLPNEASRRKGDGAGLVVVEERVRSLEGDAIGAFVRANSPRLLLFEGLLPHRFLMDLVHVYHPNAVDEDADAVAPSLSRRFGRSDRLQEGDSLL